MSLGIDLISPVFVVGLPRSGTTNLHNLIINNFSFTGNQFWELSSPSTVSNNKYINEKLRRLKSSIGFYFYRYLIHLLPLAQSEQKNILLILIE